MISTPQVVIERIGAVIGAGEPLAELACRAATEAVKGESAAIGGVIAATFSNPDRFPSLAVKVASELGLASSTPAFDLQLACSAYPYALYLAGKLAADTGKRVLVIDGDVQSALVDAKDHATGKIFSDAATATVVTVDPSAKSDWDFMSRYDTALMCSAAGPIRMDGMAVFTFVATEVTRFLKPFGTEVDCFVPHQANPYMIRQLAKSLGLEERLVTLDAALLNPGSCSVPLAIAKGGAKGRALVAGFGAGYSASAGLVRVA